MMMKNVSRTVRLPVVIGWVGLGLVCLLFLFAPCLPCVVHSLVHSLWVHDDFVFGLVVAQKRKDSIEVRTHRCCVHPFLSKELLRYVKKSHIIRIHIRKEAA